MKVLLKFFKNNGHLLGAIYTLSAVALFAAGTFDTWSKTPPANYYVVAAFICLLIATGLNALRGYLDQHLSRTPDPASELSKDKSSVKATVTPEVTPPSNTPVDPTYYGTKSK